MNNNQALDIVEKHLFNLSEVKKMWLSRTRVLLEGLRETLGNDEFGIKLVLCSISYKDIINLENKSEQLEEYLNTIPSYNSDNPQYTDIGQDQHELIGYHIFNCLQGLYFDRITGFNHK